MCPVKKPINNLLKETDTKFPLCNRLFAVPSLRQRYLAHFKTMFNQCLDTVNFISQPNIQYNFIDSLVSADPKTNDLSSISTGKTN